MQVNKKSSILNKTGIKKENSFFFCLMAILLSVFCVLKVLRGSNTDSETAGGIWNYISLLYYPLFIFLLASKKKYNIRILFISAALYIVISSLSAIFNFSAALNIASLYQLLMIPYAILVFFVFYLCAKQSTFGNRVILIGYFICLILNLYTILIYRFADASRAMKSDVYFSLGLCPFALLLLQNTKIKTVIIAIQFLVVFLVDKRTALISFILALVVYLLLNARTTKNGKIIAMLKAIVGVTVIVILFYYIGMYIDTKYDLNIYNRLFNLVEDGGSGRTDIYEKIWVKFNDSTLLEKLFGHGMNTAGKIGGAGQAHNDFLEILYDYGIISLICAVGFYLCLIIEGIRLIKRNSPYAAAFAFSLIIGLFLAMFSYFLIYYTYVTCVMAFWGFTLAMEQARINALTNERGQNEHYRNT